MPGKQPFAGVFKRDPSSERPENRLGKSIS
jgi:hypothetical protein